MYSQSNTICRLFLYVERQRQFNRLSRPCVPYLLIQRKYATSFHGWSTIVALADPEILKSGAEDNAPASLSFIADAYSELYTFYTGKGG